MRIQEDRVSDNLSGEQVHFISQMSDGPGVRTQSTSKTDRGQRQLRHHPSTNPVTYSTHKNPTQRNLLNLLYTQESLSPSLIPSRGTQVSQIDHGCKPLTQVFLCLSHSHVQLVLSYFII